MTTAALTTSLINPANALLERIGPIVGRSLLSSLFIASAVSKIQNYGATAGYMDSVGVPGALLPAVIAFEILVPLAVIFGFQLRLAALALAGFSIVTAVQFHFNFADQIQTIMFLKNIAIAGGFISVAASKRQK